MKNKNFVKINIIYFIAICLVCVWFILGYCGIITNDIVSSFLIQIVTFLAIPLLLYTIFCSKNIKKTFSDTGFKKISLKMIFISILIGILLYFLNGHVANFFQSIIGILGWENLYSKFYSSSIKFSYKILLQDIILTCIFPAICEEFIHRGILLHANKKFNTRFCLYLSSILFGLVHLNISQFFYAAVLGFIMGYMSLIADSIYPSMIMHFLNNFLNTYMFYGVNLKWKLPTTINKIQSLFNYNYIIYLITSISAVTLIVMSLICLVGALKREKIKYDTKNIIKSLKAQNIPLEDAQKILNEYNYKLKATNKYGVPNGKKPNYLESVFYISSLVVGGIVTLSTFLWGII